MLKCGVRVHESGERERDVLLTRKETLFGRNDPYFWIKDSRISRTHAVFTIEGKRRREGEMKG